MTSREAIAEAYRAHVDRLLGLHARALERGGCDRLAIYSGRPRIRFLDDSPYPFAANPLFKAWVPLTRLPESWLVVEPGAQPTLIYHQPDDYWHCPPSDPAGFWVDSFRIEVVREADRARALLGGIGQTVFLGEETGLARDWGFGEINPRPVVDCLHYHRAAKSDYELLQLRRASDLAVRGHQAARAAFEAGASEYAIHQAYLVACAQTDPELPYSSIVALNEHGAVLHYDRLDREPPPRRRSFLIDAGAQCHGYASDITRTQAAAPGAFADLVAAMEAAQLRLVESVRAGVDYRDCHLRAHREVATLLADAGLVDMDPEAMVDSGVSSTFLPHGLGHLIGVQVHDVGGHQGDEAGSRIDPPEGHPFLRLTRRLEPGYVLTVEPGLYFIRPLLDRLRAGPHGGSVDWKAVEALVPFGGIRIEDDVVVQPEGPPENLTRDAFRRLAA